MKAMFKKVTARGASRRPIRMLSERRINQVGLAGLAITFVLLVVALASVLNGFAANTRASEWVNHTHRAKAAIADAENALERTLATHNGYLLDPHPGRLRIYRQSAVGVAAALDRLDAYSFDNAAQRDRIVTLRPMIEDVVRETDRSIRLASTGDLETARSMFPLQRDRLFEIRAIADALEREEDLLLDERLGEERRGLKRVQNLLIALAVALVITALGTIWLLRRNVISLYASQAELRRLNTGLESAVAARTADIKRANEEIQRFAYIVSHDLRAPLVNVMGFTSELEDADRRLDAFLTDLEASHPDLVTKDAVEAVREDLPEALGFIRTSSQKMDRLIDAILRLSRQGRRVLSPERLAMADIVQQVADSLTTLAEERGASIAVEAPLPEIVHDRIAIEQIFTNLIENALKYLRPGVPGAIAVRGSEVDGRAVFEIEDNGRGIKPEDHARIFELFRRSGTQDQRGEGIGLATVRALAYRLGGTVTVTSRFGEGSVFTVSLPMELEDDEGEHDG